MRNHGSIHLLLAGMIIVFLDFQAPGMLAAQARPLIKVVAGFRAPGGAVSAPLISEARGMGMNTIEWDVDPTDWSTPGTDAIYSRVVSQTKPGSIILMHDGGGPRGQTLAALPRIIHTLRGAATSSPPCPTCSGCSRSSAERERVGAAHPARTTPSRGPQQQLAVATRSWRANRARDSITAG